ncbi:hypothetical protein ACN4EE_14855 [Geminocystis sp. CENA526]|uniref:hypothetical protein n=1 Tax=Geminocystis sp. CENA526 TaxID=1355871 RepID=UPI003D6EDED9
MSTVTDNNLKELKDLINSKFEQVDRQFQQINSKFEQIDRQFEQINSKFEQINSKFEKVFEEFTDVKVEIATIKEGQKNIEKRLDNLDKIAFRVFGGIIIALLVGLVKMLYPNLLG